MPGEDDFVARLLAEVSKAPAAAGEDADFEEEDDDSAELEPPKFEGEFSEEKQHAFGILLGIAQASATADETFALLKDAEPVLVYFLFRWLKKYYHKDHDDYEFVKANLSDVRNSHRQLTRMAKDGEEDPLVEWFEGNYKYREMTAFEFIDLIIEKLEG